MEWLPVIATLAGATVGGGISILVNWLSARNQERLATLRLAEERAIWAANRHIEQLRDFHRAIEALAIATEKYRITCAWEERATQGREAPSWVIELGDTRGGIEQAFRNVVLDASLIDEDLLSEYGKISKAYWDDVMLGDEPVKGLMNIEKMIETYRKAVAERYRSTIKARTQGSDVVPMGG